MKVRTRVVVVLSSLLLAPLVLTSLAACTGNAARGVHDVVGANAESASGPDLLAEPSVTLTAQQSAYIDSLRESGGLRIATRTRESVFEPDRFGPGQHGGMEYRLAERFASMFDLELTLTVVDSFSEYFTIDGTPLGPDDQRALAAGTLSPRTPDLLRDHHILVDGFSTRPWREALMRFVRTSPGKDVVVARKDTGVRGPSDLDGAVVAVADSSSYASALDAMAHRHGIRLRYLFVGDTPEMSEAVANALADATALGSISALFEIQNHPSLTIAFPLSAEASWSNWAVARDSEILADVLERFFDHARSSGIYESVWREQFDFSHTEYLRLLDLNGT